MYFMYSMYNYVLLFGVINDDEDKVLALYTVSHKKRATLFLIITLAFLGRFLYFLHQWKRN